MAKLLAVYLSVMVVIVEVLPKHKQGNCQKCGCDIAGVTQPDHVDDNLTYSQYADSQPYTHAYEGEQKDIVSFPRLVGGLV